MARYFISQPYIFTKVSSSSTRLDCHDVSVQPVVQYELVGGTQTSACRLSKVLHDGTASTPAWRAWLSEEASIREKQASAADAARLLFPTAVPCSIVCAHVPHGMPGNVTISRCRRLTHMHVVCPSERWRSCGGGEGGGLGVRRTRSFRPPRGNQP